MLEQPELHLHPALQMRLADLLVACVESGRQIIVETTASIWSIDSDAA